mmetsp:Transcript_79281/g.201782  ORF Transcript_79281/g.201782 Transcript_79281/m.201782 type:complete len:285 (+) Transcript_79281:147-1001(+)
MVLINQCDAKANDLLAFAPRISFATGANAPRDLPRRMQLGWMLQPKLRRSMVHLPSPLRLRLRLHLRLWLRLRLPPLLMLQPLPGPMLQALPRTMQARRQLPHPVPAPVQRTRTSPPQTRAPASMHQVARPTPLLPLPLLPTPRDPPRRSQVRRAHRSRGSLPVSARRIHRPMLALPTLEVARSLMLRRSRAIPMTLAMALAAALSAPLPLARSPLSLVKAHGRNLQLALPSMAGRRCLGRLRDPPPMPAPAASLAPPKATVPPSRECRRHRPHATAGILCELS